MTTSFYGKACLLFLPLARSSVSFLRPATWAGSANRKRTDRARGKRVAMGPGFTRKRKPRRSVGPRVVAQTTGPQRTLYLFGLLQRSAATSSQIRDRAWWHGYDGTQNVGGAIFTLALWDMPTGWRLEFGYRYPLQSAVSGPSRSLGGILQSSRRLTSSRRLSLRVNLMCCVDGSTIVSSSQAQRLLFRRQVDDHESHVRRYASQELKLECHHR